MKIDIQELVINKIKDMEKKRLVENVIEETVEKTIIKAITEALEDYKIRRDIEEKVTKEVSSVVADIGFTAYNSFIAQKVKSITEGICNKDIADKIQKTFDEILVIKRESIKLSEICDKYREWICSEIDESDKYSLGRFYVNVEESEYGWLEFKFGREKPTSRYGKSGENSIEFIVHKNNDKRTGWISRVTIDGYGIDNKLNFAYMSDIALLLVNIAYNKTPIEIDVESEYDIDNSFDVDI